LENIDLNVNVSLADLVNGSYKIEKGERLGRALDSTDIGRRWGPMPR